MYKDYSHIVYIAEKNGQPVIRIDRLFVDRRDFYTEIELAKYIDGEKWDTFDKVSEVIGKSLCIDAPKLREFLKIDDASDSPK